MASRDLADLVPALRALADKLLALAIRDGCPLFVTSTLRTWHEQDELYASGRTAHGSIVTNAEAGLSWHNYGMAFDVAFVRDDGGDVYSGPWETVGTLGRSVGLAWGGDWPRPDRPHFELSSPFTTRTMRSAVMGALRRGPDRPLGLRDVQRALDTIGFAPGPIDGAFGPRTEAAVQAFQTHADRLPTGIVLLSDLERLAEYQRMVSPA